MNNLREIKKPIIKDLGLSDILIKLRVRSYYLYELHLPLLHDLQVTFCVRVASDCLLRELRVTFCIRVTS